MTKSACFSLVLGALQFHPYGRYGEMSVLVRRHCLRDFSNATGGNLFFLAALRAAASSGENRRPLDRGVYMSTQSKPRARRVGPTRREMIMGGALVVAGTIIRPARVDAQSDAGISHSADSIHQEPSFTASRRQVYEALTNPRQFDQVTRSSGVMKSSAMASMKAPTQISRHAGGPFTLFGGYIVGRHIELVPDELVVQAWRTVRWDRGVYSIVRFEIEEQGTGTKILFDHVGFPKGEAEHLAAGWQANYWSPMDQFLAKKSAP